MRRKETRIEPTRKPSQPPTPALGDSTKIKQDGLLRPFLSQSIASANVTTSLPRFFTPSAQGEPPQPRFLAPTRFPHQNKKAVSGKHDVAITALIVIRYTAITPCRTTPHLPTHPDSAPRHFRCPIKSRLAIGRTPLGGRQNVPRKSQIQKCLSLACLLFTASSLLRMQSGGCDGA